MRRFKYARWLDFFEPAENYLNMDARAAVGLQASCPSCGAPIEFGVANSVVTVCDSCGTVVGRADGQLEQYGKVAELIQTDSPLQLGLEGKVKGVPYEVTGRVQLRHAAGGVWDEWYVALRGGKRWGWLAEAQGRYYLTFPKKLPANHSIPPVAELQVEDELVIPKTGRMKVAEVGVATAISAEGEIPYAFRPGETYQYADLVGRGGKFATLDASEDPPALYVGGEFPLERLGIETAESRAEDGPAATALAVTCPNCGGSLDLKAPDESERVVCPYCDSLLDIDQGNLRFLEVLKQDKVRPVLPLGSEGTLRGRHYTVIGFLQREVTYEGETWRWQEFLLYTPRKPFHWLIYNVGHWSLGKPVSPAEVDAGFYSARLAGRSYRLFDRSTPVVSAVYGEFYWKVKVGERVKSADFIAPPYLLSREESLPEQAPEQASYEVPSLGAFYDSLRGTKPPTTTSVAREKPPVVTKPDRSPPPTAREVNYTLGEYIPAKEVKQAFGLKHIRWPTTVAPNQPYPYTGFLRLALLMLAAALLAGALVYLSSSHRKVLQQTVAVPAGRKEFTLFSQPFKLGGWRNIRIDCSTNASVPWAYFEGSFYNEKSAATKKFGIAALRRRGPRRVYGRKYLSRMPSGMYTLRLTARTNSPGGLVLASQYARPPIVAERVPPSPSPQVTNTPAEVQVVVYQNMPRLRYWIVLVVALMLLPIGMLLHRMSFEQRRWAESDYNPYSSG